MYMRFDSAVIPGCDIFEWPVADVFVCEECLRPLTLLYLVPFDPLFLYFCDAADYSWFKISTVPGGLSISSVRLSLSLSPSRSSLLSPTNWRQPHCQFHARVVSIAAEITHCKIDLNNCKVERQGKAGEWNRESLLPFATRFIAKKELSCIAYSDDIDIFTVLFKPKYIVCFLCSSTVGLTCPGP